VSQRDAAIFVQLQIYDPAPMVAEIEGLEFRPVTRRTLGDLERFSACHGKFRYCSCMRWRLRAVDYRKSSKDERVARLAELARENAPVGVLAYRDGEPVGWCAGRRARITRRWSPIRLCRESTMSLCGRWCASSLPPKRGARD